MKNARRGTDVGSRSVYPEKHENCTALDNKREEQSNVLGDSVQMVHVLDVYVLVCMQRSTT